MGPKRSNTIKMKHNNSNHMQIRVQRRPKSYEKWRQNLNSTIMGVNISSWDHKDWASIIRGSNPLSILTLVHIGEYPSVTVPNLNWTFKLYLHAI